jgi:predicted nucleotidyltransferase
METFGDIIRKKRKEAGLTLKSVGGFLHIDQAILSKAERGQRRLMREQVVKLAGYLKVKEEDLMIAWLSDKLVYEVKGEVIARQALKAAEERIDYLACKKIDHVQIENIIKDYFKSDVHVKKAWLFGSYARGENDFKSDIDLMIEVWEDSHFSLFDLAEIQYQLEERIPIKVDIVMKEGVRPHIMERIMPDLKLIYEK